MQRGRGSSGQQKQLWETESTLERIELMPPEGQRRSEVKHGNVGEVLDKAGVSRRRCTFTSLLLTASKIAANVM